MSARDTAELNRISSSSFLDDLTASKNDQLRNTMNSGIAGNAPDGAVVARKTRNPQTMQETREEISRIEQQKEINMLHRADRQKSHALKELIPFGIVAYFLFK